MTVRPVPLLLAALALAVPLSLLAGQVWIDPLAPAARNALPILIELRLPRAVLALLVGGGLGAAGAAMQGYCAIRWPIRGCSASRRWRRWARCCRSGPAMPRKAGCCRCSRWRARRWGWRCWR
jgi:hypothetical protein